jgi:hypothetical protein
MRFSTIRLGLPAVLAAVVLLSGCVSQSVPIGKDDLRMGRLGLRKGDKDFSIHAVTVPGLLEAGPKVNLPALARIGESGGNTVCFDLCGISADGKSIDPKVVETLIAYAQRCKGQYMTILVRVLAKVADDPAVRENAVKTVAKALRKEGRAAYWIDGPNAAELAKKFKKTSPNLLVAAPANGDLTTVDAVPPKGEGLRKLVIGQMPDDGRDEINFVLPADDAVYARMDKAFTDPVELKPWTPDNSVLSEQDRKDGFIALFDGKTLNGWFSRTPGVMSYAAKDGCLEWVRGGSGAIMTRDRYDNFVLRFDWKIKKDGNSGVWCHAPRDARASKIGFEFQIMGDSASPATNTSTGSIYEVVAPKCVANKKEGEWNTTELILDGSHYKATLNGKVVQDIDFNSNEELKSRLKTGFICLTDHGNWVSYRNIRLKKL